MRRGRLPNAVATRVALAAALLLASATVAEGQRVFPGGIHPKHDDRIGPRLPRPDHGAAASDSAGPSVALALFAGTLPTAAGAALPADAQHRLLRLLNTSATDDAAWWVDRLAPSSNADARPKARALVSGARALLGASWRLGAVVAAYNDFVDASSAEFLRDPPPEFLAMQATLARLAAGRRGGGATGSR